jgi:hypothetical protein
MKTFTSAKFKTIRESGPRPGATQFAPIGRTLAQEIADDAYDNVMNLHPCAAGDWAVECPSGIVANVGTVDGQPAILHRFGGERQLCILARAESPAVQS